MLWSLLGLEGVARGDFWGDLLGLGEKWLLGLRDDVVPLVGTKS